MPEWGIALIGLLGVLIGVGVEELRSWREERDKYKVMSFQKRLEVHQEAMRRYIKLHSTILDMAPLRPTDKEMSELSDHLKEESGKTLDWWSANCLYLDQLSQASIGRFNISLLKESERLSQQYEGERPSDSYMTELAVLLEHFMKGVGAKYLPDVNELVKLHKSRS